MMAFTETCQIKGCSLNFIASWVSAVKVFLRIDYKSRICIYKIFTD